VAFAGQADRGAAALWAMSTSAEESTSGERPGRLFDARSRAVAARVQEAALPSGSVAVSCSAPLGAGGLGRHVSEIVDTLARRGQPTVCISGSSRPAGAARHRFGVPYLASVLSASPVPLPMPAGTRTRAFMAEFDARATAQLPRAEHLIAFNGQSLAQAARARRERYRSYQLVSANSHMRQVVRQHARAHRQYPLEGSWTARMLGRNLAEYERADRIFVASRYIRESFLQEGFANEMLIDFPLTPAPRFEPSGQRPASACFEIVYIGSLAVHKGVPLLVDAFRRLGHGDLRLVLVGGWASRGMRRFIEHACAADRRISVGPGDPLPHLRSARLVVHPAYEDGFAYAPAEALACGVPVIVSEDTGMKELIDSPRSGVIVPTGDLNALTAAIDAAYRGEIFS